MAREEKRREQRQAGGWAPAARSLMFAHPFHHFQRFVHLFYLLISHKISRTRCPSE